MHGCSAIAYSERRAIVRAADNFRFIIIAVHVPRYRETTAQTALIVVEIVSVNGCARRILTNPCFRDALIRVPERETVLRPLRSTNRNRALRTSPKTQIYRNRSFRAFYNTSVSIKDDSYASYRNVRGASASRSSSAKVGNRKTRSIRDNRRLYALWSFVILTTTAFRDESK